MQNELAPEPGIYFNYLCGKEPDARSSELYRQAIAFHNIQFGKKETRLHNLSLRFPFLIQFIDGGLALTEPLSHYRKNIYIILCILEARPEFFSLLSSSSDKTAQTGFFNFIFHGTRAAFTGVFGFILVKLV